MRPRATKFCNVAKCIKMLFTTIQCLIYVNHALYSFQKIDLLQDKSWFSEGHLLRYKMFLQKNKVCKNSTTT